MYYLKKNLKSTEIQKQSYITNNKKKWKSISNQIHIKIGRTDLLNTKIKGIEDLETIDNNIRMIMKIRNREERRKKTKNSKKRCFQREIIKSQDL